MRNCLVTFFVIIGISFTANTQAASVCEKSEKEFFSCQFQRKTATLCGSKDENSGHLYLRYVVKKAGKLEMQYPPIRTEAAENFKASRAMLPHGGYVAVSFSSGEFKYILRQAWDTHTPAEAEISVLRNGKRLIEYSCDNEIDSDLTLDPLTNGTIPSEEYWWPDGS